MCGIAGIVGDIEPQSASTAVRRMLSALARRGPDSEGIETWHAAVLGHRRLAIFDLSKAGNQPMLSKDRSVGVVFNGAIYNYRELRKELIALGYAFESNTDTEVLIHGYQQWGLDRLVSNLRGMFAFALWDNSSKKLYLTRDRLGVKPLVFTVLGGAIVFASTVRALKIAGYLGDIDENAVVDFLKFGFVTDDRTIYQHGVKVPAGTIIEWSDGVLKQRTYWQPPSTEESSSLSFDEAVEETERLLLRAVELRLHADVPVGALLSGGIDSSLVCWAVAKLGGDIRAYTIGTPGHPWDETAAASETAQTLKIQHQILTINDSDPLDIKELMSAYAEPFACASALGMLRL
jgi:asparagine synthase (glutamine-hydrolysing)